MLVKYNNAEGWGAGRANGGEVVWMQISVRGEV